MYRYQQFKQSLGTYLNSISHLVVVAEQKESIERNIGGLVIELAYYGYHKHCKLIKSGKKKFTENAYSELKTQEQCQLIDISIILQANVIYLVSPYIIYI